MSIYDEIECLTQIKRKSLRAKDVTTLKCGGQLECVFEPANIQEYSRLICAFETLGTEPFLLAGGSNVLVLDGVVKTPVILTKYLDKIRFANGVAFAECGAKISNVLRMARQFGYGGLEFIAGVPLTLGGALKMNASAFGRSICDFVESVFVFPSRACGRGESGRECAGAIERKIIEVPAERIGFGYRKGVQGTIVGAKLRLDKMDTAESLEKAKEYLTIRRKKQPSELSLGSVFKNGETPSGKLIEGCGLKGVRIGGAQISERHANFIVNSGGATAEDFLALVELCEREVQNKYNVKLEREFVILK